MNITPEERHSCADGEVISAAGFPTRRFVEPGSFGIAGTFLRAYDTVSAAARARLARAHLTSCPFTRATADPRRRVTSSHHHSAGMARCGRGILLHPSRPRTAELHSLVMTCACLRQSCERCAAPNFLNALPRRHMSRAHARRVTCGPSPFAHDKAYICFFPNVNQEMAEPGAFFARDLHAPNCILRNGKFVALAPHAHSHTMAPAHANFHAKAQLTTNLANLSVHRSLHNLRGISERRNHRPAVLGKEFL